MKKIIDRTIEACNELLDELKHVDFKKYDVETEVASCNARKKLIEVEIDKLKVIQENLRNGVEESKKTFINDLNKRAAQITREEDASAEKMRIASKKEQEADQLKYQLEVQLKECDKKKSEYDNLMSIYQEKLKKIKELTK